MGSLSKSADRHRVKSDRHKPKKPTPWGRAAVEILRAAGVQQVAVSNYLREQPAYVNRFFTGQRRPSPDDVKRIDHAIAELTGHLPIEDHLDFVATGDLLKEERFGDEALAAAAARCLRWYGRFFKPGGVERVGEYMSAFAKGERRKLVLGLNSALRRIIVEEFLPPTHPVGFTGVFEVLKKSGIDTREIVSEQCAEAFAWEHFEWVVRRELATADPRAPANKRLAATRRVLEAVTGPVLAAVKVSPDAASGGALLEVKTMELGKQVCRFDGDPQAAWRPFMPPTQTFIVGFNHAPSVRRRR